MDLRLEGKTAYVSGGAKGIGAALGDAMSAEGVRVAASDIDAAELEQNVRRWGSGAVAIPADLSGDGATAAAEAAIEALGGPPDILVNNVGEAKATAFAEIDDEAWLANYQLNFMSHVRASRTIVPRMAAGNGGVVLFMASDLAKQPEVVPVEYATVKVALVSLTKILALEYAPTVRVNALCPGPIWTDLWTKPGGVADTLSDVYGVGPEEAVERFIDDRHLPLGIGEPADVANLATFLCSPLAKHINAAAISIDGGGVRGMF